MQRVCYRLIVEEGVDHAIKGCCDNEKHYRVHHGNIAFANGERYINGINSLWSYAKRMFIKLHDSHKATLCLNYKEDELRINYRNENTHKLVL